MKILTVEITYVCMYVCIYIYVCKYIRTYTHTSLSKFSSKIWGFFALIHIGEWGTSFPYPSLSFSPPYLTSSQAPRLPPNFSTRAGGDSFEVERWGRLLCDAASSIVPTECTVPCLCRLSCGQEAAQREGTKVWSLQNVCFKSHFTRFPPFFFFFKGKKKALFVFVLFSVVDK